MGRLAKGEKTIMGKKEMHNLTEKNYKKLPEVQKKKVEEEKKEDLKRRMEKVKQLDQKLRNKK